MLQRPTYTLLHELRLQGMAAALEEQEGLPDIEELSFHDRLVLLLEHERTHRADRRFQRLLGRAHLRLEATVEDLDFRAARGLDRSLILRLASCEWIREGQTLLLSGPTGSGKSYLACALGHQACRHGLSTQYYRLSNLLEAIDMARRDGSRHRLMKSLRRTQLLVVDDWGLAPLDNAARHDLLEVLDDRYARRGTLFTSQVPPDHWHEIIGDPTFGDAILDRLLHNAHKITLTGGSMRRVYDSTKGGKSIPQDTP
jgi:DNA replication protein DnaC